MKKILLGLLAVVGLAVLAVVGLAASKPDAIHVERSTTVTATAADVHPFADDFTLFTTWIPWTALDPSQKTAYSDPPRGVGAWYTWEGNDQVGKGKMTLLSSAPEETVHELEFIEPFPSKAEASVLVADAGEGKVKITWAFNQQADFGTKVMTVFMDMDSMLGADFEKGLANLGPLVEKAAAERVAAEQKAAQEAAAAAEAAAAEAAAQAEPVEGARSLEPGKAPGRTLKR
jgi:hypothetical protein